MKRLMYVSGYRKELAYENSEENKNGKTVYCVLW